MSGRVVLFALCGILLAGKAGGQEDPLAPLKRDGEVITARWRSGALPADPASQGWREVAPAPVALYPQGSVSPGGAARRPVTLNVRALYNEDEMALLLEWADMRRAATHEIGRFPDAAAVQWPVRYGPGIRLPYVGMGHAGHPVALWFWRADGRVETLAAEGFGSLTSQPADGVSAKAVRDRGRWRVALKRPLASPPGDHVRLEPALAGLVPVAFAVWNGEAGQRDGDKLLSPWRFLLFERGRVEADYARSLAWSPRPKGDPRLGKALMAGKGCLACHSYPGNPVVTGTGPDLTWAGVIHRPDYLLESVVEPSAVLVPDRKFHAVEGARRISLMPRLDLSPEESAHLVAFLRTLRGAGR